MDHPPPRGGGRVLLVGAGHAHLHLLARADRLTSAGHRVTLVSPDDFWYSGAATGVLAGVYRPDLDRVDVGALARRVGVARVNDRMVAAEPADRAIRLASGGTLYYDVLSVNVGSVPLAAPAGAREHAVGVKPVPRLLELTDTLRAAARDGRPVRIVVVGGGPSGCEVALALERRARREGARVRVTVAALEGVVPELPRGARRTMREVLSERGVHLREGVEVTRVGPGGVEVRDGSYLPAAVVVDATGLRPAPVVERMGLPLGPDGGLLVDRRLRSTADPRVLGAGDCVDLAGRPLPRVGVYAVRQAPVLLHNVLATLEGRPLRRFDPQDRYLLVLALGDGTGLAVRGALWGRGRWAFRLKDWLDRRFLRRYRVDAG